MNELLDKYRMVYDHHTHTVYSHGLGTIEDNVRVAYEKGLRSVAITDHGPGNFSYGVKLEKIPDMRRDAEVAMKKYPGIKVLIGVEANTLRHEPYLDVDSSEDFDVLLAGYHFAVLGAGMVPNWIYKHIGKGRNTEDHSNMSGTSLLVKNTEMIMNALYYNEENGHHIQVLTHPGDKGPFDIEDIAKACADTGTLLEINAKHPHLSVEEIRLAARYDVRFIIGSDAHRPEAVGTFKPQLMRAFEAGLDPERIVNIERI